MTTDSTSIGEMASMEIQRLLKSLDALAHPACCKGAGTSVFQVMGRDGKPTGEEIRLCDACGREIPQA